MTQMSDPGGTSISTDLPAGETPVCRPPLGNDTHSVHCGRRQVCAEALHATSMVKTAATRAIEARITGSRSIAPCGNTHRRAARLFPVDLADTSHCELRGDPEGTVPP